MQAKGDSCPFQGRDVWLFLENQGAKSIKRMWLGVRCDPAYLQAPNAILHLNPTR